MIGESDKLGLGRSARYLVSGVSQTKIAQRKRIELEGLLNPNRELRRQLRVKPIASCGEPRDAAPLRTKVQAGANVFRFKIREIRKQGCLSDTLCQHFKNVGHSDTHSTNTSATAALMGIEGDAFIKCHICTH